MGVGAMIWLGLWQGLRARSQAGAILWTVILAKGVPFLISFGVSRFFLLNPIHYSSGTGIPWLILANPQQIATFLYFLWLIQRSRFRLLNELEDKSRRWSPTAGE
jgi:hypothetical protein